MKVDPVIYEKVAKKCHAYSPSEENKTTNAVSGDQVSCCCCEHFDSNEHCVLDLYDKIVDEVE